MANFEGLTTLASALACILLGFTATSSAFTHLKEPCYRPGFDKGVKEVMYVAAKNI